MGGYLKQKNRSKAVLSALFDVRPVTSQGDLDIEKIRMVEGIVDLRGKASKQERKQRQEALEVKTESYSSDLIQASEKGLFREQVLAELAEIEEMDKIHHGSRSIERSEAIKKVSVVKKPVLPRLKISKKKKVTKPSYDLEEFYFPEIATYEPMIPSARVVRKSLPWRKREIVSFEKPSRKSFLKFVITGSIIALVIPVFAWFGQGLKVKDDVLTSSLSAYQNLLAAQESLEQADWQAAERSFGLAHLDFFEAHEEINKLGYIALGILEQLPGTSSISSGRHLVKVGENLSQAGQSLSSAINLFSFNNLSNLISLSDDLEERPLTESIALSRIDLSRALENINLANQELGQVNIAALPDNIQEGAASLKEKLPLVEQILIQAMDWSDALLEILGHSNPRQYLLIFQNNSEIRATGGFIGTYGLITLDQGKMKDLFVDGIFNADGQLHEKIIPPRPIQKVSTAWSMHDANWFADFPTSAQKIAWFYEKTGGPTVDGVISLTPVLVERLLELTGPVSMPEYDVVLDSSNFVELIQYKVEVDYDKELNQPKKILADFAPKFIKILSDLPIQERAKALEIVLDALHEKHILVYFDKSNLENLAIQEGWAGELISSDKDYLSVVSSNINGYKTDRVVKETINHQSEIQSDGSVINTLTIVRQHQGGDFEYDWWNRVNSNYLRVYLPLGSELISAKGQSMEVYQSPIDYQAQGFKADPLVSSIENEMVIDEKTGTHIFTENNKTVFGNWVYVSPGKTVSLTYKYRLPFKIDLTKSSDSYSLLVQKQSGSLGSQFNHQLIFPDNWQMSWQYPDHGELKGNSWQLNDLLTEDKFSGVTFEF